MLKKILLGALAPLAAAGLALGVQWGSAAHAAPATVTQVTHIVNRPDSGNGPNPWAYDSFTRTLTVTVAATQNPLDTAAGKTDYTATVTDAGRFSARQGELTPNQDSAGGKIAHAVTGSVTGSTSYTVVAPSTDNLVAPLGTVTEDDNFAVPAGDKTTGEWPQQVFATPSLAVVTEDSGWSWTYATACEQWVDSSANGDGNLAGDGNITGQRCSVPRVYDTGASYVAPTRERFSFRDTLNGYVKVEIFGPGPIGGHTWHIAVKAGVLNTGVITGLTYHRDYTLAFTPVNANGHQVPGSHTVYQVFTS